MATATAAQTTLAATFWLDRPGTTPQQRAIRAVILAIVGTLLLWASAKVKVPFWPVPMTMQTFAVLVIGMAYGWRLGGATLLLYLAEGAVGLPVFAAGGGITYFAGPTTGYLIGFVAAAVVVGWLAEQGWDRSHGRSLAALLIGDVILFVPGVIWLSFFVDGLAAAIAAGVTPFILGEIAKIALAAVGLPLVWRLATRDRGHEQ
ncbi:MAG: biotin transporter BioY [Alphaproteobacteria bacterium]